MSRMKAAYWSSCGPTPSAGCRFSVTCRPWRVEPGQQRLGVGEQLAVPGPARPAVLVPVHVHDDVVEREVMLPRTRRRSAGSRRTNRASSASTTRPARICAAAGPGRRRRRATSGRPCSRRRSRTGTSPCPRRRAAICTQSLVSRALRESSSRYQPSRDRRPWPRSTGPSAPSSVRIVPPRLPGLGAPGVQCDGLRPLLDRRPAGSCRGERLAVGRVGQPDRAGVDRRRPAGLGQPEAVEPGGPVRGEQRGRVHERARRARIPGGRSSA